jgi:hypothetical protein
MSQWESGYFSGNCTDQLAQRRSHFSHASLPEAHDVADGGIGLVVRGFQLAIGAGVSIGLVVKEAIGQRPAELLWNRTNVSAALAPLSVSR